MMRLEIEASRNIWELVMSKNLVKVHHLRKVFMAQTR